MEGKNTSKKNFLPQWMREFITFGLVGVSGMGVDFSVVVLLRELFGLDVRIGIFPAFIVAVTWNYELNRRITFKSSVPISLHSYLAFLLTCTGGLAVRWLATHAMIEFLGFRDDAFLELLSLRIRLSYIAYVAGIGVGYLFNFVGSKFFAFKKREESD